MTVHMLWVKIKCHKQLTTICWLPLDHACDWCKILVWPCAFSDANQRSHSHSLNSMNALCINCEIERIPLHRLLDASIALLHYVANKQHLALFRTVREFKCCHLFIMMVHYKK